MTVTEVNGTTSNNVVENKEKSAKVEELISEVDEITLEDLAPDGGWGWMIALAMILIIVSIIMYSRYNSIQLSIETDISLFIYK